MSTAIALISTTSSNPTQAVSTTSTVENSSSVAAPSSLNSRNAFKTWCMEKINAAITRRETRILLDIFNEFPLSPSQMYGKTGIVLPVYLEIEAALRSTQGISIHFGGVNSGSSVFLIYPNALPATKTST